jgi:hypothetical protein
MIKPSLLFDRVDFITIDLIMKLESSMIFIFLYLIILQGGDARERHRHRIDCLSIFVDSKQWKQVVSSFPWGSNTIPFTCDLPLIYFYLD